MKKMLLGISLLLGITTFSQSKYQYVIKIDKITNVNKEVTDWLKGMFTAAPVYNESDKSFTINSDFDISQSLFTQKTTDRNLTLLSFNKIQVVTNPPVTEPTK